MHFRKLIQWLHPPVHKFTYTCPPINTACVNTLTQARVHAQIFCDKHRPRDLAPNFAVTDLPSHAIARAISGPCGGVPSPPMPSESIHQDGCRTRISPANISPVSGPSGSPEQPGAHQACTPVSGSEICPEDAPHHGMHASASALEACTPQRRENAPECDAQETPASCPPQRDESASPRTRDLDTPASCPPQRIEDISGAATPKSGSGIEWGEKEECCVCFAVGTETEGGGSNPLYKCSSCGIRVHKACYGIDQQRGSAWKCQPCELGHVGAMRLSCKLCPNVGSAMKRTKCKEWVHILCALWVSNTCSSFLVQRLVCWVHCPEMIHST